MGRTSPRHPHHALKVAAALASAMAAGSAAAQAQAANDSLAQVVVVGRSQFLAADTQGATNLPLPIEKVPQSISIVSADFIKEANLKTLGDIASYTAGAINAGNPENNGSVVKIRGFAAGRAIDGINTISSYTAFEPDFVIFDRLEVVQGPASVVYGISSPGGLVNYVTKSATSKTPSYVSVQGGSWSNYRVEGQVAGSLDADDRVRAIGIAALDGGNSFTNGLTHRKSVLYGGVNVDITDSLTGSLHAGYETHSRPAFDGIPTLSDGSPAPVSRSLLLGSRHIKLDTSARYATGTLTWTPRSDLDVALKANYERTSVTGGNSYGFGLQDNGDFDFNVTRFNGPQVTVNYGIGLTSTLKLDNLGLKDSFVSASLLYQNSKQSTDVLYPDDHGSANIFSGQQAISDAFDALYAGPLPNSYPSDVKTQNYTGSVQALLKPTERLAVLAGASYSKPRVDTMTLGFAQDYNFKGQTSYRAGLTYEVFRDSFAYVSYSGSFSPQPLLTIDQQLLPPLSGKQYEAGIKYRASGSLLVSGAVYRITQNNLGEYDQSLNGADYYKPVGEVTHKGYELKALGKVGKDVQLNVGYARLDAKITQDSDPTVVGRSQLYLPKNTFSAYGTYILRDGPLPGLTLGGGVRYIGAEKTSYDGSTKDIPAYTLVDVSLAYETGPWSAKLNGSNIFNRKYYINNYQTLYYGNVPGTPAQYSFSLTRTFK